ncbi:Flowering time control protein FCA [Dorcoceras hygrometricum]|uniref:Flowering time control protein FCA n=1 Tax=Dorcoceras hygrometricum TaxID=472368 RepID=A0A2Z7BQ79_9LAMI|nr:Flowering time control protein FCA [Dorcoceras hygrometricum]
MRRLLVIQTWIEGYHVLVSDLVARDFVCGNYSSELRYGCELVLQRWMWHGYMCLLADLLMLELEDERVTPVYLISLLGSVSHYERSYHGFTAGRGVDPADSAPGGG